jgi:hypothetical protein
MLKKISTALVLTCIAGLAAVQGQTLSDDWQTLGLWHMDSTVETTDYYSETRLMVEDDDSVMAGRGKNLVLGRRIAGGHRAMNQLWLPEWKATPFILTAMIWLGAIMYGTNRIRLK